MKKHSDRVYSNKISKVEFTWIAVYVVVSFGRTLDWSSGAGRSEISDKRL